MPGGCCYDAASVARSRARTLILSAILTLALVIWGTPELVAQTPGKGSAIPELIGKQFETKANQAKRDKRLDLRLPLANGAIPPAGQTPLFVLKAVELAGVTAFSADEMAESYRSLLGKPVSEADLGRIVEAISQRYRRSGYALSRAVLAPQDVHNGRLRITVLEGRIEDIVLKGNGGERFGVRRLLQPVLAQRPVKLETLERHLLLASDTPGARIVDVVVEEIGEATGRFRLIVDVQTWRVWAGFDLDNRGTPAIGPLQAFMATAFNSVLVGGDTLAINLSTNPDDTRELRFGGLLFEAPLGSDGARLAFNAFHSDIWPGDERRALHGRIRTENYAVSATIAALRSQSASLWLSAVAALRDEEEGNSLGSIYQDHIRAVGIRAAYQQQDPFRGTNYFSLGLRQGLDILGASERGDAQLSRADGSGTFSKINVTYMRHQPLSERWSVVVSAVAQAASNGLLASEEFYLGGAQFGRAFRSADVSGDGGAAAFAEVRFEQQLQHAIVKSYQLYGFVDTGTVWDRNSNSGHISLSSFGGGLRLDLGDSLRASFEIAIPMGDYSPSSSDGGPALFFALSQAFKSCSDGLAIICPAN